MHFSKIATVLFFTAVAVAAPAPEAAPADGLVARTSECPPPNACKKNGKYYPSEPSCPVGDSYRCSTTALIVRSTSFFSAEEQHSDIALHKAIANCNRIIDDVKIDVAITELLNVILYPH